MCGKLMENRCSRASGRESDGLAAQAAREERGAGAHTKRKTKPLLCATPRRCSEPRQAEQPTDAREHAGVLTV